MTRKRWERLLALLRKCLVTITRLREENRQLREQLRKL
jgi:hypothetical protein